MARKEPIRRENMSLPSRQLHDFLQAYIERTGLTYSEVGERCGLSRDVISRYAGATNFPNKSSLSKLALGLRVQPKDIVPSLYDGTAKESLLPRKRSISQPVDNLPALSIQTDEKDPTKVWLRVNQLVSRKTARAVMDILDDAEGAHDTSDRAASS